MASYFFYHIYLCVFVCLRVCLSWINTSLYYYSLGLQIHGTISSPGLAVTPSKLPIISNKLLSSLQKLALWFFCFLHAFSHGLQSGLPATTGMLWWYSTTWGECVVPEYICHEFWVSVYPLYKSLLFHLWRQSDQKWLTWYANIVSQTKALCSWCIKLNGALWNRSNYGFIFQIYVLYLFKRTQYKEKRVPHCVE